MRLDVVLLVGAQRPWGKRPRVERAGLERTWSVGLDLFLLLWASLLVGHPSSLSCAAARAVPDHKTRIRSPIFPGRLHFRKGR
jgi:hypothetical protein